jgi:molecular chaperone DnaK (HSP70)
MKNGKVEIITSKSQSHHSSHKIQTDPLQTTKVTASRTCTPLLLATPEIPTYSYDHSLTLFPASSPSWVAFTDDERLVGDAAKNQFASNPHRTVFDIVRNPHTPLLGY